MLQRCQRISRDPAADVKTGELHAVRSIFLGKKSYLDELSDGVNKAYHIRMKGIPLAVLQARCNKDDFRGDPYAMYTALLEGRFLDFELGVEGHVMFQTNKNHTITTTKMTRSLFFGTKVEREKMKQKKLCDEQKK